jgi:hypothetical protein
VQFEQVLDVEELGDLGRHLAGFFNVPSWDSIIRLAAAFSRAGRVLRC